MATILKLKSDIKKLKGALASKGLSASIKGKLKTQLEKAQNELTSMQKGGKPRKTSTTKGTQSALANLKALVKKKKYGIYKGAGVDLKKDSEEPALAIGRRVSKGLKGNQYGSKKASKGNVYYEYRANRLDVKQPSKSAKYPKLEKGGYMAKGGKVKEPTIVRGYFEDEAYEYNKGGYMADGGVTEKEVVESNVQMVLSQIKAVKHHADELSKVVTTKSNIEAWVVGKIERASTDLSDITHYLDGQHQKMSMGGSVYHYTHKMDKK
jgi:hypothetical protein